MASELTDKQQQVLKCIENYWREHGVPPSIADVAAELKITRATAYEHLNALKRKGALESMEGIGRSWRPTLTPALSPEGRGGFIPLLGRVAAGRPILAVENIESQLVFEKPNPNDQFFALRVQGDSMIEGHIADGDLVIVRKQETANDGDIVVALVNGEEATVKKLKRQSGEGFLVAMNPTYKPIAFAQNQIEILGKVIEVRRCL